MPILLKQVKKWFNTARMKLFSLLQKNTKNTKKIALLAPVVKSRKGHYRELFEQIAKQGYLKVRIDGELTEIIKGLKVDRYKTHDIEVVIDRLKIENTSDKRLTESVNTALKMGDGVLNLDLESGAVKYYSKDLMCPTSGTAYPTPEPNTFSFNSQKVPVLIVNGLGYSNEIILDKIIPDDSLNIKNGGIAPLGTYKNS